MKRNNERKTHCLLISGRRGARRYCTDQVLKLLLQITFCGTSESERAAGCGFNQVHSSRESRNGNGEQKCLLWCNCVLCGSAAECLPARRLQRGVGGENRPITGGDERDGCMVVVVGGHGCPPTQRGSLPSCRPITQIYRVHIGGDPSCDTRAFSMDRSFPRNTKPLKTGTET